MDFAKLVTDYLNQRTEGDPSFIVSEEALAFVDLMRADDMDRRASSVEEKTSADARGEPTTEQVTNESRLEPTSESHGDAEELQPAQSPELTTEPAAPFSSVAPEESGAAGSFSEQGPESQPAEIFTEQTAQDAAQQQPVAEDGPTAEPASIFTQDGTQTATNDALREDGVTVEEHSGLRSETTTIFPESMPDFESLLRQFDSEYKAPDPPAGDEELIPEADEIPEEDPLQNTTEFAEGMMSEILSTHLAYDRRGV